MEDIQEDPYGVRALEAEEKRLREAITAMDRLSSSPNLPDRVEASRQMVPQRHTVWEAAISAVGRDSASDSPADQSHLTRRPGKTPPGVLMHMTGLPQTTVGSRVRGRASHARAKAWHRWTTELVQSKPKCIGSRQNPCQFQGASIDHDRKVDL